MRWSFLSAAFASVALLTACGGAPKPLESPETSPALAPAEPSAEPPADQPTGEAAPEEPGKAEQAPSSTKRELDQTGQPVVGAELRMADDVGGLFEQFQNAEKELLQAGNVCSHACRALRSMQRAANRMCELASSPDEEARCESANRRYRGARERVRSACQVCPEGPALDGEPDAG